MTRFAGRYVFVAGLHRTGTSLLARLVASHPEVAALSHPSAPEDEGCYVQGAIPHTARHGIPGHYATDPEQHLIEGCRFDTRAVRARMEGDWHRWFSRAGCWRVEKSPVNLTRMRLYQQLFPMAQFVIVLRHPAVMAAALAKWTDDPAERLIDYALDAYDRMVTDLAFLHCALVIRYEDVVRADPLPALCAFLDLPPVASAEPLRNGNADYPAPPPLTVGQARRAGRWGYGGDGAVGPFAPIVRHPLRHIREKTEDALRRP